MKPETVCPIKGFKKYSDMQRRSLGKERAYKMAMLFVYNHVSPFQYLSQVADFHEISYKRYYIRGPSNIVFCTVTSLGIVYPVLKQQFRDWIMPSYSGGTYSVGPIGRACLCLRKRLILDKRQGDE
jgi:hypothetical protein